MAAAWWQRGREGSAAGGRAGEGGAAGDAGGFQHLVSAMPHGGGDAAALKLGFLVSELTRFFAPGALALAQVRPGPPFLTPCLPICERCWKAAAAPTGRSDV